MGRIITLPPPVVTSKFTPPGLGVFVNEASLLFNGSDQYIGFGDNYNFGPAVAFSISFWLKAQNFSAQRALITKTTNDANVHGLGIYHNNAGKIFVQLRAPGALTQHTFGDILTAGVWYHICLTYAGGSNLNGLNCYINGALDSASPAASAVTGNWTNTDPLEFGRRNSSFYYSGNLNHVSFWNKALSLTEVGDLYNAGKPGNLSNHPDAPDLLSWWYLSTAANFNTEVDQAGAINGTLNNFAEEDYDAGDVP